MKVLFGLSNEDTVKGIVKFYEDKYKEKLEYKIAYYFKNFSSEIATGDYDRAVLSEELEKMPTKSYAEADKLLFEYIDGITNNFEARNLILITSERRKLGDNFLARLFVLGVYTTLTGSDRTKGKVCAAINSPTTKKEARRYYDNNTSATDVYNSSEVSELELRRIITYFKNLNGDTSKYCEIFDRVVSQYTTEQMAVIIKCLPKDVTAFLQDNSESYKNIVNLSNIQMTQSPVQQTKIVTNEPNNNKYEIKNGNEIAEKIVVKKYQRKR